MLESLCAALAKLPRCARLYVLADAFRREGDLLRAVRLLRAAHEAAPTFLLPLTQLNRIFKNREILGSWSGAGDFPEDKCSSGRVNAARPTNRSRAQQDRCIDTGTDTSNRCAPEAANTHTHTHTIAPPLPPSIHTRPLRDKSKASRRRSQQISSCFPSTKVQILTPLPVQKYKTDP